MPKAEKAPKNESQCTTWDFTMWDPERATVLDMRKHFAHHCKAYAFQLERGDDSGKLHYQGRFVLKTKDRKPGVVSLLSNPEDPKFCNIRFSVTSTENRNNMFYVMKDRTRADGPWTDKDRLVTSDVAAMETLRPWQQSLREILKTRTARNINLLVDKVGGIGKSSFVDWMYFNEKVRRIPALIRDPRDMAQFCMSFDPAEIYIIDLPRMSDMSPMFFTFVEELKNGWLFDTRYHGREIKFERPEILICTNKDPDTTWLSMDRWKMWQVTLGMLCVYKPPPAVG